MSDWGLVVFGVAGFLAAILSGISGGGGGFITTPLAIFLGLTPAQAISTGKFSGLALAIGSLVGLREANDRVSKARVIPVIVLAFVVGLFVPHIIKAFDNEAYRVALGVIILLMIPIMIVKKVGVHRYHPKTWQKFVGSGLLTVAFFIVGIFSGGLGVLVNMVLIGLLGMTAIEANITKRWAQLVLNIAVILGVLGSGLIVWQVMAVGVTATFFGGLIGGKLAVKKGDAFVMNIMIALMFISGLALIFGA